MQVQGSIMCLPRKYHVKMESGGQRRTNGGLLPTQATTQATVKCSWCRLLNHTWRAVSLSI